MNWLQRLLRRDQMERELDKELRFHIDRYTADLIARGIGPDQARRRASRKFPPRAPCRANRPDRRTARGVKSQNDARRSSRSVLCASSREAIRRKYFPRRSHAPVQARA